VKGEKNFIWKGTLPDVPSTAIIIVRDRNAAGVIRDNLDLYRVEPVTGGIHALIEIDQSKFPPEEPPSFEQKEREKRGEMTEAGYDQKFAGILVQFER
jgi:hypothetical protein